MSKTAQAMRITVQILSAMTHLLSHTLNKVAGQSKQATEGKEQNEHEQNEKHQIATRAKTENELHSIPPYRRTYSADHICV